MPENPWTDPARAGAWSPGVEPDNPLRAQQLDVLLQVAAARPPRRILDLGCGPGAVARQLLDRFTEAVVVGVDISEPMLSRAGGALGAHAGRARLVQADLLDPHWPQEVVGDFDLAVAVQVVAELAPSARRALYRRVHALLAPGGLLLVSDRIRLADPALLRAYVALWNSARARAGFEPLPPEIAEGLPSGPETASTLEEELRDLRRAGYQAVDGFWRHGNRAVFGGIRPW